MTAIAVCTPGGASDNSYVSLTDADAWFTTDWLRAEQWQAHSSIDREHALVRATRDLNEQGGPTLSVRTAARRRFTGVPYSYDIDEQALHFPRANDWNDEGTALIILPSIVAATCEQALWLLQQRSAPDIVDHAANQAAGIKAISQDGLSITYGGTRCPDGVAPAAWKLLRQFVISTFGTQ
jgi:hypothetical protein